MHIEYYIDSSQNIIAVASEKMSWTLEVAFTNIQHWKLFSFSSSLIFLNNEASNVLNTKLLKSNDVNGQGFTKIAT